MYTRKSSKTLDDIIEGELNEWREEKGKQKLHEASRKATKGIEKLLMEGLIGLHVQHSTHVSHVLVCKRREGTEEARDQIRIDFRRDGGGGLNGKAAFFGTYLLSAPKYREFEPTERGSVCKPLQ